MGKQSFAKKQYVFISVPMYYPDGLHRLATSCNEGVHAVLSLGIRARECLPVHVNTSPMPICYFFLAPFVELCNHLRGMTLCIALDGWEEPCTESFWEPVAFLYMSPLVRTLFHCIGKWTTARGLPLEHVKPLWAGLHGLHGPHNTPGSRRPRRS